MTIREFMDRYLTSEEKYNYIHNMVNSLSTFDEDEVDPEMHVSMYFDWTDTDEGDEYWDEVYMRILKDKGKYRCIRKHRMV